MIHIVTSIGRVDGVEVPPDCAELICQCCVADPLARPSMSGAAARVREIAQSHEIQLLLRRNSAQNLM